MTEAGESDFVEELAGPLPSFVVATYLGVPEDDRDRFGTWSDAIVQANATGTTVRDASEAVAGLYAYFTELVERRRRQPGPDMLSDLVAAEVDGQPLHLDEILGYCFVMIAGGNDTASGLLAGMAIALTAHREQRRRLLADPGLHRGAVEELLRLTSPVQGLSRTTTRDVGCTGGPFHRAARSTCCTDRPIGTLGSSGPRPTTSMWAVSSAACSASATGPTTASEPPPPASRASWSWRNCSGRYPSSRWTRPVADWRPGPSSGATNHCPSPPADRQPAGDDHLGVRSSCPHRAPCLASIRNRLA